MPQEKNINDLHKEMTEMRDEVTQIKAMLSGKKEREAAEKKSANHKVTKVEAADILFVSPRHLQRIRVSLGLKWMVRGNTSYYYLKNIVEAIQNFDLPWNCKAYEKVISRISKLPIL